MTTPALWPSVLICRRSFSLRRPKRNIRTAMNHGAQTHLPHTPHFSSILDSLISCVAAIAEVMMYAIAQKEQLGFDKAVEECKYRMSRYGVTPNMMIMPPQVDSRTLNTCGCLCVCSVH